MPLLSVIIPIYNARTYIEKCIKWCQKYGLNVVLDLSMIINFHMGVRGAALATVIAQGISAVLCFIYMAKKYPNLRFDHHARSVSFPIIKKLINIAVPMALQYSIPRMLLGEERTC